MPKSLCSSVIILPTNPSVHLSMCLLNVVFLRPLGIFISSNVIAITTAVRIIADSGVVTTANPPKYHLLYIDGGEPDERTPLLTCVSPYWILLQDMKLLTHNINIIPQVKLWWCVSNCVLFPGFAFITTHLRINRTSGVYKFLERGGPRLEDTNKILFPSCGVSRGRTYRAHTATGCGEKFEI